MARGRPRGSKNKSKQVDLFQEVKETEPCQIDTPVVVKKEDNSKPLRITGYCTCCGREIYSGLIHVSLSSITGNATWSRSCSVDKLTLCSECAKQLNEIVDKWIISKNPELKKPFCIS